MPYADIIILALIAGFILLRLRAVLGQKSDQDPGFFNREMSKAEHMAEPVVQLDEKSRLKPKEEPDTYLVTLTNAEVTEGLNAIKAKDAQFTATLFLEGAKMAYEMVFDAFAKGDRQTLKMLLADNIYQDFSAELDKRDKAENRTETTLVAVVSKEITRATLNGNMARITVQFASDQVTVVRDPSGKIVEGNASDLHRVEDEWVFERDVTSKNPNWKIIET